MRYAYLVLLGLLMAGLAGCGGGGDGGKNDMIATLESDLAMLQADLDAAQGELETTKETLTETQGELETTKETLTDTQGELDTTKETLTTTQQTLTTTQGTLTTTQQAVNGLLSYAGVMSLPELRTKLEEDREAFDDLDNAVGGLLSYANVMTLPGLRTKLEEDREAFDDLDNAVGGLLSYANVMSLPELRTQLENDAQAHTDLQDEVDAVLRAAGVMDLDQLEMAYKEARSDYDTLVEHVNTVVSAAGLTGTGATGVTNLQTAYNDAKSKYDNLNSLVQTVLTATGTTDRNNSGGAPDLNDLQALVAYLNSEVSRLAGEVGRLRQNAQTDRTELENQVSEAEQATVNARAGAYLDALTPAGEAQPGPRTGVSVTYDRGGTLTINPGGNFQTGSGAPGISGFTARAYTREVGVEGEETLYLYTNIQAPSTRHFWKIHGLEVDSAEDNSDFNPTPTASARYIPHSTDSTMATGVRVSGRYDGVSGTFTCEDGVCMGLRDNIDLAALVPLVDGERSFAQGSWTFKPSSITGGVSQMRDNEHLYFGIWVREPNVASEDHAFQYIAGGLSNGTAGTPALTNFGALSGTAMFSGGAIGKYVTRNQVGENAKIGTFTASANFTANFDANNLEGRITSFREGGQALPGDWNVYLGAAGNMPATFTGGSLTAGVSSGRIGGVPATGDWSATLYGTDNTELAEADREDYPATRYPVADLAGLTGSFRASSTNAALAGTFGATPSN